ncbi:MAG: glycosyltransferase family 4 protein [Chthoniobacteraceae bacterium]
MNLLNIIQCTNLGGMEQASLRLMKGFIQNGHRVSLLSLNPLGALTEALDTAGISSKGLDYIGEGRMRNWLLLRKLIQASAPDSILMTGHNLMAQLALGNVCWGRRVLAIHFHHSGVKRIWQWRIIYANACKRFRAIVFPSEFVRREAENIYPPLGEISHVIRYPMEMREAHSETDRQTARNILRLPGLDVPLVGNAGWLIKRKRWDVFLKVAAKVSAELPKVRFVIAGDGPEKNRLMSLATDLGIQEKVFWLGWIKEMKIFYQSLNAVLFNSDWDALPVTPQEAMSYGVPVVASILHGGLGEIILDHSQGFLLHEHETEMLADRLCTLIADPILANEVGKNGSARIALLSSPEKIGYAYEKLLRMDEGNSCSHGMLKKTKF